MATSEASGAVEGEPILRAEDLVKWFNVKEGSGIHRAAAQVRAVNGVTFDLRRGETLGLVGESGCGKSTLGRTLLRLEEPTSGRLFFDGRDVLAMDRRELRALRRRIQIIFQDPYASLNPRMTVGELVCEPWVIHRGTVPRRDQRRRAGELLERVGLDPAFMDRYPHQFSGGQRQRIGIARVLALDPEVIVCDEPVSALDVSIQAQVLNLLVDLQRDFDLTYVFITHDLSVVRHVSDRIAVMYLGKVVEVARTDEIFETTRHPYTKALLSALPVPDPDAADSRERIVLTGDMPSPINPPSACRYHPRCPKAQEICSVEEPPLVPVLGDDGTHLTACHFPLEVGESLRPSVETRGPKRGVPR